MTDPGETRRQDVANGSAHAPGVASIEGLGGEQFETIRRALAERRRELGITMSELARQIGVSPSMISQIERGQTLPSVATLFGLAAALGATVDAFFADSPRHEAHGSSAAAAEHEGQQSSPEALEAPLEHLYVVRAGARSSIEIRGGVHWERLTPGSLDQLEFLELVYEPHAQSDSDLYRHPGAEVVLVLEGAFTIHVGFDSYDLAPGDSIAFPSSLPHRYVNPTDSVSRAVTVILRESLGNLSSTLSIDAVVRALRRDGPDEEAT
jgi:transcriptional regulator with XRE-family HTH domain